MAMIPANGWEAVDTTQIWGASLLYLVATHFGGGYIILREDYDKLIENFSPQQAVLSIITDNDSIKIQIKENTENLLPYVHYIGAPDAETYEEAERTPDKV